MKTILMKFASRACDLANLQPVVALFLGAALLAVFLTAFFQKQKPSDLNPSLLWRIYQQSNRFTWAAVLVLFLAGTVTLLRGYLGQTVTAFLRNHGRITEANYNAVQTIWGAEQVQGELSPELFWEEEITERIESEDLTIPAILRKKTVRHTVASNPFIAAHHEMTLKQNPRKKGSALYGGYETTCRFDWHLQNPSDRALQANLKFPLPADRAMYDALTAKLDGKDVLPQVQLKEGALILPLTLAPRQILNYKIAFKSRGMSFWYFQVKEAREIRDFSLTMILPDLPKSKLNYPEGCMTPTEIKPTNDNLGSILNYDLDHAISSKGMGISLPTLPQPGETTRAVLQNVEAGWMLFFAVLILTLTLTFESLSHAVLVSVLFGAATAFAYGLLGDFSDLLFEFWGTAAIILLPAFVFLAWLLTRVVKRRTGKLLAAQLFLYGILYPALAGLDGARETLYFNLCTLVLLGFVTWLLTKKYSVSRKADEIITAPPTPA
ncbi:MAG: hypothetical protein JWM68_2814 [Verrucomicrobiales bacterium]|nr:hypothetical protein [Verrucomicrobiales bacterium]